jgi:hypothetical protein
MLRELYGGVQFNTSVLLCGVVFSIKLESLAGSCSAMLPNFSTACFCVLAVRFTYQRQLARRYTHHPAAACKDMCSTCAAHVHYDFESMSHNQRCVHCASLDGMLIRCSTAAHPSTAAATVFLLAALYMC